MGEGVRASGEEIEREGQIARELRRFMFAHRYTSEHALAPLTKRVRFDKCIRGWLG